MSISDLAAMDVDAHLAGADFENFARESRVLIDQWLDRLLPGEEVSPTDVHGAIRWSVFAGGKRFRPLLLLAVGETFSTARESLINTACALEMIHTYSLIHDDLPSMDNDDLRRGRATCHIRFGESVAILAGDALQTLAFETISKDNSIPAEQRLLLISEIAAASGTPAGMVAGQARDLAAESRDVTAEQLKEIHLLKTGALITAAARCGAIIANSSNSELVAVTDYATQLGLLFQITDDLLDLTATVEALGKTPGKDLRARKATYPSVHGVDATKEQILGVYQAACASLAVLPRPTPLLQAIAESILKRRT